MQMLVTFYLTAKNDEELGSNLQGILGNTVYTWQVIREFQMCMGLQTIAN